MRVNHIQTKQAGFLKYIIVFIALISLLTFLNVDIKKVVESPFVQKSGEVIGYTWSTYMEPVASFVWNDVIQGFLFDGVRGYLDDAGRQIEQVEQMTATSTSP